MVAALREIEMHLDEIDCAFVSPAHHVTEMLRHALDLEKSTMQAYHEAHALTEGDIALRTMLEGQIESEQRDIEELEMYLGMVKTKGVESEVSIRRVK